jgi:hypothetical protein
MKTLKFVALAVSLAVTALAARAEVSAQAWLESYYLNPQPEQLAPAIRALSRSGYFEKPGHTPVAIGFLSTVFAQNPERVDRWLLELNGLPLAHHRLIAASLYQAGHPLGAEMLRSLAPQTPVAQDVLRIAARPATAVADTPVLSPSSMNLQWGAFLATGNEVHVVNILQGIGTDRPTLSTAARYALAENAAAHPRVLEICRSQLDKQPKEVQSVLRAALQEASAALRQPPS